MTERKPIKRPERPIVVLVVRGESTVKKPTKRPCWETCDDLMSAGCSKCLGS